MFRIIQKPDLSDVKSLERIACILEILDRSLADRITLRQVKSLIGIALADQQGRELAISGLDVALPFRSLRRLQALGLIDMEDSPDDRRNTLLSLTDDGRRLITAVILVVT